MIITVLPDLHLTDAGPSTRTDDVLATQLGILRQIIADTPPGPILFVGDFLDTRRVSNRVFTEVADLIEESGRDWIGIPGQHDLRQHSLDSYNQDSDLALFARLLPRFSVVTQYDTVVTGDAKITCYPWGVPELSEVLEGRRTHTGIGIAHAAVCDSEWPGAIDIRTAHIKGSGVLFFGDIHKGFLPAYPKGNKNLVCVGGGVLTPMKINELAFSPSYHTYDTSRKKLRRVPIDWERAGVTMDKTVPDSVYSYVSGEFISLLEGSFDAIKHQEALPDYIRKVARENGISKHVVSTLLRYLPDEND